MTDIAFFACYSKQANAEFRVTSSHMRYRSLVSESSVMTVTFVIK